MNRLASHSLLRAAFRALVAYVLLFGPRHLLSQPSDKPGDAQKKRIEILRKQLSGLSMKDRTEAAALLGKEGPAAIAAADDLLTLLLRSLYERQDGVEGAEKCRSSAFDALASLGPAVGRTAVQRFKQTKANIERATLIGVIWKAYRPGDREIEQLLTRAMYEPDADLRTAAIGAVAAARIRAAIPLMTEIAADAKSDSKVSGAAAASLGWFGKDAEGSSKTLVTIIQHRANDMGLRYGAIEGLAGIGIRDPADAVLLLKVLQNEDEEPALRAIAARAFDVDRKAGQKVLPDLIRFLQKHKKNEEEEVKTTVLVAISGLRPDKDSLPTLAEFVDDDETPAVLALEALAKVGPEVKSVVPKIMDAITRQRPIAKAIHDGIAFAPDHWEPILRQVFGREGALEMVRASIDSNDPDVEAMRAMAVRLSKR